jgi:magnesium chelatase subunit I
MLANLTPEKTPIAWWHRSDRYAERLAPGTNFVSSIGEIDYSNGLFV